MARMPPGFRFKPSKEELVNHYLYRKIYGCLPFEGNEQDGLVIPDHFIIPDLYIYDYDPMELQKLFRVNSLAQLDNGECYFFCPRRNKYRGGHEENRATNSGYWKSRGKKRIIVAQKITAEKIGLTFYRGRQRNGIVTEYMMHQYRLVSNNIYPNIIPQEIMPYDLCYIFLKKTKQDQGDNAPQCNGYDSSTIINGTTNDLNIYTSQIQSDQGDQTIALEETYISQPQMYYGGNEIYPIQHNFDLDRELTCPSTAYAHGRSYNTLIPVDHQVDQPLESEEIYSLPPQLDNNRNVIYPPWAYI